MPAPAVWQTWCVASGLQRVMQALGAFGFLGHVKGKCSFLAHIPAALQHLRELLDEAFAVGEALPEFPILRQVVFEGLRDFK